MTKVFGKPTHRFVSLAYPLSTWPTHVGSPTIRRKPGDFTDTAWNCTVKPSPMQVTRSSSNGLTRNDTVVFRIPATSIAILNWRGLLRIGLSNATEVFRSCSVGSHVVNRFGRLPAPTFQSKKPRCWPMIRCLIVLTAIRLLARIF